MKETEDNRLKQIERELIFVLKEEYSFYQSLYIILDKQRDTIKFDSDEKLLDLFAEIERCQKRINRSNEKIDKIKNRDPKTFAAASSLPEVIKIVNSIATMVKKNTTLVTDCQEYLKGKYDRIKDELGELQNCHKIMQYVGVSEPRHYLVDGKK